MKTFIKGIHVLLLLVVFFAAPGFAQEKKDWKTKAEAKHKTAIETKGVIESVFAEVTKGPKNKMIEGEIKDAVYWKVKADTLLVKCEKKMEKSEYTKKLVYDLDNVWQMYVKTATVGLRIKSMQARLKKED